jgi:hypothetical protein
MSQFQVMSQSAAVVSFVKQVLGDRFQSGADARTIITKEDRKVVINMLVAGFLTSTIEMSADAKAKYSEESKLRTYASGLTTNWLNKSKELNGGTKYEAKNPGVRSCAASSRLKVVIRAASTSSSKLTVPQCLKLRRRRLRPSRVSTSRRSHLSSRLSLK